MGDDDDAKAIAHDDRDGDRAAGGEICNGGFPVRCFRKQWATSIDESDDARHGRNTRSRL